MSGDACPDLVACLDYRDSASAGVAVTTAKRFASILLEGGMVVGAAIFHQRAGLLERRARSFDEQCDAQPQGGCDE